LIGARDTVALFGNATYGGDMAEFMYQDPTVPTAERVADLLSRMTLEEKAGQLFQAMIAAGADGEIVEVDPRFGTLPAGEMINNRHMSHFNVTSIPKDATALARWYNNIQRLAETTRLGIPVTISSDPRHSFTDNVGTSFLAGIFSEWPETLGIAAIGSEQLAEEYGDVVRREYLACGIRTALHPQIDLATEPRWARASGTFGEDADLTSRMAVGYIHGMQATGSVAKAQGESGEFGHRSISTMTKHFPGGGPQLDGEDPHFDYGREQVYPGGQFNLHLKPFLAALAAGTRQMMPYYGMPIDLDVDFGDGPERVEPVGFGFNKQILTTLLREKLGFTGIICTDWGLVTDVEEFLGQPFPARAWGVEQLTPLERAAKIIEAGADQFGGEACPELVVELVKTGVLSEARLDESVARLLAEKFDLGLFDDARYVDEAGAAALIGNAANVAAGRRAQSRSITVLQNASSGPSALPLAKGLKVYAEGIDPAADLGGNAVLVSDLANAEVALLRLKTPFEERGPGFQSFFHAGSLEFAPEVVAHVQQVAAQVPTIVDVYLERPAIMAPIVATGATVVANYGASPAALFDALTGTVKPEGKLPFDLPRSMAAVAASREDVPFDTKDPLYQFGHGLTI